MIEYSEFAKLMREEIIFVRYTTCVPSVVRYYYYQNGVIYYDESVDGVVRHRRIESIADLHTLHHWIDVDWRNYSIINVSRRLYSKRCIK